jgi:hypothetical protein
MEQAVSNGLADPSVAFDAAARSDDDLQGRVARLERTLTMVLNTLRKVVGVIEPIEKQSGHAGR